MRAAAGTVVVSLLGLLVRAYPEDCRYYGWGRKLAIDISTNTDYLMYQPTDPSGPYYITGYGADIILLCCSRGAANLTISHDENYVEAVKFNKSSRTFRKIVINANLGMHKFHCEDMDTGDAVSLRVKVEPAISVISTRVHHAQVWGSLTYFVPLGEAYNVSCVGKGDELLSIFNTRPYPPVSLQSDIVNATAVKHSTKADNVDMMLYECRSEHHVSQSIVVLVNHYPAAVNFQCILHERRTYDLVCTWSYPAADVGTSKLFQEFGMETMPLCMSNVLLKTGSCVASINHFSNPDLILVLQTCNSVFCANQTFYIDYKLNTKLDAPSDLRLVKTNSHGVAVAWHSPVGNYDNLVFKVEYRMLGTTWQQADTSSVKHDYGSKDCTLQIHLTCPEVHHELRVYVRTKDAVGDKLWSEPSNSIFFYTGLQNPGEVSNPECTLKFNEQPPASKENLLHEVRKLMHYERKHKSNLKGKVIVLKDKLRQVDAINLIQNENA